MASETIEQTNNFIDIHDMKILFCSPVPLQETLGTARTLLSLSTEFQNLGWEVKIISPADTIDNYQLGDDSAAGLRKYLLKHASEYDVVEYDHSYLPFPRTEFANDTLFVARSQLLGHHFATIAIPAERRWQSRIRAFLEKRAEQNRKKHNFDRAHTTILESDVAVVLNYDDRDILTKHGIAPEKIHVIPNGLSPLQMQQFDRLSVAVPSNPKVAFIGTFCPRKGSTDFPAIIKEISRHVPEVSFRFLGTTFARKKVLSYFPKYLRNRIEVYPDFEPDDLPSLLQACSVGMFPSYIEGFGLAVLEMLAASIPVIAYNAPGPPMMLDARYLVPRGDTVAMAEKIIGLFQDSDQLASARHWAKQRSKDFCWQQVAQKTSDVYLSYVQQKNLRL
jgi:glycosyltransferase involved in cell wall biosynthesis